MSVYHGWLTVVGVSEFHQQLAIQEGAFVREVAVQPFVGALESGLK